MSGIEGYMAKDVTPYVGMVTGLGITMSEFEFWIKLLGFVIGVLGGFILGIVRLLESRKARLQVERSNDIEEAKLNWEKERAEKQDNQASI